MRKYKGRELALSVFESAMAVFYVLAGIGLLMWKRADTVIQSSAIRIAVAVVLLLYGIFRIYRAIRKLF